MIKTNNLIRPFQQNPVRREAATWNSVYIISGGEKSYTPCALSCIIPMAKLVRDFILHHSHAGIRITHLKACTSKSIRELRKYIATRMYESNTSLNRSLRKKISVIKLCSEVLTSRYATDRQTMKM